MIHLPGEQIDISAKNDALVATAKRGLKACSTVTTGLEPLSDFVLKIKLNGFRTHVDSVNISVYNENKSLPG